MIFQAAPDSRCVVGPGTRLSALGFPPRVCQQNFALQGLCLRDLRVSDSVFLSFMDP